MSTLRFRSISFLSTVEKKARRVMFDSGITVIHGANDTGKSSLLKSLYASFGAEPAVMHWMWKKSQVVTAMWFTVGDTQYIILRHGKRFGLFDAEGRLQEVFNRVTKGLGPKIAQILGAHIKLRSKDGEEITPPPAYLFLPFYFDQDRSWQTNWSGFDRLTQIPKWRKPIIEYHTGMVPDEWYVRKAEQDNVVESIKKAEGKLGILLGIRTEMHEQFEVAQFNMDVSEFALDIEELLAECDKLRRKEEILKSKLVENHIQEEVLRHQIGIVSGAASEIHKDFEFATHKAEDIVECPTCGACYDNDFISRFSIAEDEDRLVTLMSELHEQLDQVLNSRDEVRKNLSSHRDEIGKIEQILQRTRSEVTFKDVVRTEGKKEVSRIIRSQIRTIEEDVVDLQTQRDDMDKSMRALLDKKHKDGITRRYRELMDDYLFKLDVHNLPEAQYGKVTAHIRETGSDTPRALLAYYYAILGVMREFSGRLDCPIVIDSPNQQDQDDIHIRQILRFIQERHHPDGQTILAVGDMKGVEFDGSVLTLSDKNSLMNEKEYSSVSEEVMPLLEQMSNL